MNHPAISELWVKQLSKRLLLLSKLDELGELLEVKRNQLTGVCRRFQHNYSIVFAPSHICVRIEGRFIAEFERRLAKECEGFLNDYENLNNAYCMEEIKEFKRKKEHFKNREVIAKTACNHAC